MDWRKYTKAPKPDGPEIFSGFWSPKMQLRKEVVLAKNWGNKEIRMQYVLDYIPWSWRDIVCICDPATIGHAANKRHKCGKYARWMFRRQCLKCSMPYVNDNTHPRRGTLCWDCLVEKYGPMGGENFFNEVPRELTNLEDRGVFDTPDFPSFDF
jgi:hypothetical protein